MKIKTTFYIFLLFIVSCTPNGKNVVISKRYSRDNEKSMPQCICRFWYVGDMPGNYEFEDSCYKYNIGDTLTINYR